MMNWWLDRGIDGFRMDVINFISKDPALPDGPVTDTGYGDGMVARRGFNKPPPASYHQDRLRQAPVGHFFDVVTNGGGAMPSHASQIPVEDRWKIIAYIRALQLSQTPPGPGR